MRRATALTCVAVLALSSSTGAAADALRFTQRLEPLVLRLMRDQSLPGLAVGVVVDGELVYAKGFGRMNLDRQGDPVTTSSLFHMASVTKTFTATAVMQLVERGKVSLDAPVVTYVPYFRLKDGRYRTITVRQMVNHTSGMPDVWDYGWDRPEHDAGALERYVRGLGDLSLLSEPGARFAYSNIAYEVLGGLIAGVSGESYEGYVRNHILAPLGMKSSTLLLPEARPEWLTTGHVLDARDEPEVSKVFPYNRAHSPSSNLHSNVTDMARWAMANLDRGVLDGRRILKASSYDTLWRPSEREPSEGTGWFLDRHRDLLTVSHPGGDAGFATDLVLVPGKRTAVVAMTNCDWVGLRALSLAALDIALGFEPPPLTVKRQLDMRFYGEMKAHGIGAAIEQYRSLKAQRHDLYDFEEWALGGLGRYLLTHGEPKDALEILRFNAEEYPSSPQAQVSLGDALARTGDATGAVARYREALRLDPANGEACDALAKMEGR
jgi:CubicO group peptidase (beta-lactamase class C family)